MLITKEIDYGVRIVRALSQRQRRTARALCEEELIPRQYSYKILKKLEKAGLLHCYRGAAGGYVLAKSAAAITLFDVICAVDDELLLAECLRPGFFCPLNKGNRKCLVHRELTKIQNSIFAVLKSRSFAKILGTDKRREKR